MQMTKASGAYFLMPAPTCSMTLRLMREQVVAAHAGLARHAGGDDADVGAVERFVGVGAGVVRVEAVDRRGLRDVERLALRHALGDVEQHDVAQFFQADEMSQRSADLAGANQSNLVARHVNLSFRHVRRGKLRGWLSLSLPPFKSADAQLSGLPRYSSATLSFPRRGAGIESESHADMDSGLAR